MANWQFHFRNLDETKTHFAACHKGCGGPAWHDGRPECWKRDIPHNPLGLENSVYAPSNWVIGFDSWWKIIKDGLELVAEVGVFIASEGEDEEALTKSIKEAFQLEEDIAQAIVADYFARHANLAEAVHQSRASAARATATTVEGIDALARKIGIAGTNYVYFAGAPLVGLLHDDNKYNDNAGWSIIANPHGDKKKIGNLITNHAFLAGGSFILPWSSDLIGPVDKAERQNQINENMAALTAGGQPPYPDTLALWVNY